MPSQGMKVLADYHHHDLWESLELLCARLGWDLYRPIGMDWYEQGYWNHERKWHGDAIAKQYLEPWGSDFFPPHTDPATGITAPESFGFRTDPSHGRTQRLMTLDYARDFKPDIVL